MPGADSNSCEASQGQTRSPSPTKRDAFRRMSHLVSVNQKRTFGLNEVLWRPEFVYHLGYTSKKYGDSSGSDVWDGYDASSPKKIAHTKKPTLDHTFVLDHTAEDYLHGTCGREPAPEEKVGSVCSS